MSGPYPFTIWGLDMIGPMPKANNKATHAIIGVDYCSKWAEAVALTTITSLQVQKFIWKNIICRFGVPYALVMDNGKQFDCASLRDFCSKLGIKACYAAPYHPQANGQVEAINKIIKKTLKKRIGRAKGIWPDLLPRILWSYRTTHCTSTKETPFSLACGSETVLPIELKTLTHRIDTFNIKENDQQVRLNLDMVEKRREEAELRRATYQQKVTRYYNRNVKKRSFRVGDLVLKKVTLASKDKPVGTLGANWEGPYKVIDIGRPDTYFLANLAGKELTHPWNIQNLRIYYQ